MQPIQVSTVIAIAMVASLLAGCRDDEAERPLSYEKGTYTGVVDQKLTPEKLEELRQRGQLQY